MDADVPDLISSLKHVVTEAWNRPFYPAHWNCSHLHEVLERIDNNQFSTLPLLRKQQIQEQWDHLIEYGDFVDMVSSSGTTGRPVDIPIHKQQQKTLVNCIARVLKDLNIGPQSKILNLLSLNDMFTLGPLVWLAAGEVGAGCFRVSPRQVQRVLDVIKYHKPDLVVGNPAFLVKIAEEAGADWPSPHELPNKAYFAASAIQDKDMHLTKAAEQAINLWGIKDYLNSYGCSEFGAIGHDCSLHNGIHINEDYCYLELIHPSTQEPVAPGELGEVVVTGLTLPRGFIPVRYATGDLATCLGYESCECGRKGLKIGPVIGRIDHQIKLFGQTIYPDYLLNILNRLECVARAAITIKRNTSYNDTVEILLVPAINYPEDLVQKQVESVLTKHFSVIPTVRVASNEHILNLEELILDRTNQVKIPSVFLL